MGDVIILMCVAGVYYLASPCLEFFEVLGLFEE